MKKIIFFFLIFISQTVFSDTQSDADKLFNWAETQFPQYFSPPEQTSLTLDEYYYRYYSDTESYIAVNTTALDVHVLGEVFNGYLRVDTLENLLAVIVEDIVIDPLVNIDPSNPLAWTPVVKVKTQKDGAVWSDNTCDGITKDKCLRSLSWAKYGNNGTEWVWVDKAGEEIKIFHGSTEVRVSGKYCADEENDCKGISLSINNGDYPGMNVSLGQTLFLRGEGDISAYWNTVHCEIIDLNSKQLAYRDAEIIINNGYIEYEGGYDKCVTEVMGFWSQWMPNLSGMSAPYLPDPIEPAECLSSYTFKNSCAVPHGSGTIINHCDSSGAATNNESCTAVRCDETYTLKDNACVQIVPECKEGFSVVNFSCVKDPDLTLPECDWQIQYDGTYLVCTEEMCITLAYAPAPNDSIDGFCR